MPSDASVDSGFHMRIAAKVRSCPTVTAIVRYAVHLEGWWFDLRHHVDTRTSRRDPIWSADAAGNFWYIPIRPRAARQLFEHLPIRNPSRYTFVDIGSGKGRMLLLASKHGFRSVIGVELRRELHRQAVANVQSWANRFPRCSAIHCVNENALEYDFPKGNLVVYLFNPFGPNLLSEVVRRLQNSCNEQPRNIFLVLFYAQHAFAVDGELQFQLIEESRVWRIYRTSDGAVDLQPREDY